MRKNVIWNCANLATGGHPVHAGDTLVVKALEDGVGRTDIALTIQKLLYVGNKRSVQVEDVANALL